MTDREQVNIPEEIPSSEAQRMHAQMYGKGESRLSPGMKRSLTKLILSILLVGVVLIWQWTNQPPHAVSVDEVPPFTEYLYVTISDNVPNFTNEDLVTTAYEFYSELDYLGRCGYTMACLGKELMPTEPRGEIGHIKPTGWIQAQYDFVEGKSLYNRSHLIGFQLAGENDNERNLITATRTCNARGMLPFENMVADYIKETGNHVIYRVTPIYEGSNLVASGVQMEAMSVEDQAQGICFHVYVYNIEPGVEIDYATGQSRLAPQEQ